MRRFLAIAILLLLCLPLVAPAMAQPMHARVLLCCLHGGAHHCMEISPSDQPTLQAPCPLCQKAVTNGHSSVSSDLTEPHPTQSLSVAALAIPQAEAGFRIAQSRSRHKRGPPAALLS